MKGFQKERGTWAKSYRTGKAGKYNCSSLYECDIFVAQEYLACSLSSATTIQNFLMQSLPCALSIDSSHSITFSPQIDRVIKSEHCLWGQLFLLLPNSNSLIDWVEASRIHRLPPKLTQILKKKSVRALKTYY